jgi:integrase
MSFSGRPEKPFSEPAMPRPKSNKPKYCLYPRTGRAYVTLAGKQITLPGLHNSDESLAEYSRLIAEWLNAGRTLSVANVGATVSMIALAFWKHAQAYYVHPDGTPTGEVGNYRATIKPLRRLYGGTPAAAFGPKCLKALRRAVLLPQETIDAAGQKIISPGWSRTYANRQTERVKMIFRWAAAEEMFPASVYHALATVDAIRAGKEGARETEPVEPVAEEVVEATLPHLPPPVAALVKLQLRTGARGGELFKLRTCDIDRSGDVWKFRPAAHKTAHHGHKRVILFGPLAQDVLRPFLKLDLQAYLFTPADAIAWRNERQAPKEERRLTPSQRRRAAEAAKHPRKLEPHYNKHAYTRAVARACELAFSMPAEFRETPEDRPASGDTAEVVAVKATRRTEKRQQRSGWRAKYVWHPHQLRHTAGTKYRREGDFESAKIVLGHRTDSMTQRYAERDTRKAEEIVARIG